MQHNLVVFLILTGLIFSRGDRILAAEGEPKRPAIGSVVPDFLFTDIRYLPRQLSELGKKKAYVVIFTTVTCPIVKRSLPKLKTLEETYRDQGVQFLTINVGPSDAIVDVAYQAVKAEIGFPIGKDFTGKVVKLLGATRTPECVVLDAKRRIRYRGRIDSEFRFGGASPKPGRADLKEAIEDVLKDSEVRIAETPVDGCLITRPEKPQTQSLTYADDVAPLIKKHCQRCHQPKTAAPFSLFTYDDVKARADMIAEVVAQRRMPPWFAASGHGNFANNPSLTTKEIAIITDWVNGERAAGDLTKTPEPLAVRKSEWRIGQPDLIVKMPGKQNIPATGYIKYRYALLPYVFLKDTWVQKVQIKPGNQAVVHHCNMGYVNIADARRGRIDPEKNFVTGYVPGGDPMVLDSGVGFRIPAGSMLGLQLHYITTGEETTDQSEVGFVFAKEPIQKQLRHFQLHTSRFAIPPQAGHHPVKDSRVFAFNATGLGMFCHMHLRGKDMTFEATKPDGVTSTLLSVPNYNFDWQASYRWQPHQMKFLKGTKIDCTAHYDNSAFNPYNPDPLATVRHGSQTYHEMMYGFLFFTRDDEALNLTINPKTGHVIPREKP